MKISEVIERLKAFPHEAMSLRDLTACGFIENNHNDESFIANLRKRLTNGIPFIRLGKANIRYLKGDVIDSICFAMFTQKLYSGDIYNLRWLYSYNENRACNTKLKVRKYKIEKADKLPDHIWKKPICESGGVKKTSFNLNKAKQHLQLFVEEFLKLES